jgi:hypothetical protein
VISFLSPLFLAGAAAAAIPVLLHLLKREPEQRIRFSAVRMLRNAPVEHTSRRHLRELLLLALRMAALLLLALAFARPFLTSGAAQAGSAITVIALDTSMSMSAPGRFDRAKQLARQALDRATGDQLAVVTFADDARVVAAPGSDRGSARAAIDSAQPGFGATSYRAGLNAAADQLKGRRGTIVVVTDLLENGWDAGERATVPESARIEVVDVGTLPANLSIRAARTDGDRVLATIHNHGPQPRDAHVRLYVSAGGTDRRLAGETTAPVGADQSTDVSFGGVRGQSALVEVDDPEGIQADNRRFVVVANAGRPRVLIVGSSGDLTREAFYVQQALLAGGKESRPFDVEGAAARALGSWDAERMNRFLAVVLISTKALERHGRELLAGFVRNGGGMLVTAGADVDGAVLAEALGGSSVTIATPSASARDMQVRSLAPADVRHPVFQMFGSGASALGLVQFHRVAAIRAPDCQTLGRFTTGEPALIDCAAGEGRALILASDLDNRWNDFPLHATFVPFVQETVRYVGGARPRTWEYLVGEVPAGLQPVPGVYPLAAAGAERRLVAVNVDPAESNPARLTTEEFQTAVTRLKDTAEADRRVEAREREDSQHIWRYLLAVMIAMLIVESVVATRTA